MLPRNYRQFGVFLANTGGHINCGIGPSVHPEFDASTKLIWPNRFMSGKVKDITLAGNHVQCSHGRPCGMIGIIRLGYLAYPKRNMTACDVAFHLFIILSY